MAAGTKTDISVTVSGDGIKSEWAVPTVENSNSAGAGPIRTTLQAGDNYLPVPTGAMGFVMKPPAASAVVKRLKHHAGETGFALRTGQPACVPIGTGVATLMIHSAALEVVYLHWT